MFVDFVLRLLNDDPAQYFGAEDKWIAVSVELTFYAVPIFLGFLFLSPFLFLWIRKKRFSLKNIIISLFVSAALVALALAGIWLILWFLQGLAFIDIHSAG